MGIVDMENQFVVFYTLNFHILLFTQHVRISLRSLCDIVAPAEYFLVWDNMEKVESVLTIQNHIVATKNTYHIPQNTNHAQYQTSRSQTYTTATVDNRWKFHFSVMQSFQISFFFWIIK